MAYKIVVVGATGNVGARLLPSYRAAAPHFVSATDRPRRCSLSKTQKLYHSTFLIGGHTVRRLPGAGQFSCCDRLLSQIPERR